MRGLLIDIDGVLYQDDAAVPGAADALVWAERRGIPCVYVTNTTSRSRRTICERLSGYGMPVTEEQILTPPVAARDWLRAHCEGPAYLVVPEATREDFAGIDSVDADSGATSVVVGDIGRDWDFHRLNRAFRLLMQHPPAVLVALGMTRYWRAPDGLRLDVAPFVRALEHAADCRATVLGKPSSAFFERALALLGCKAAAAVMIGDDIRGDVGGAQDAGIAGVLVRTGKFRAADLEGEIHPAAVLDSIAELPDWWRSSADSG